MDWLQAIILGIVQGVTEFIPISSTAHVRIVPELLGWDDPGAGFTAVIQLGTLLSIFIYFYSDLRDAFFGWINGFKGGEHAKTQECRLGWAVFWGTVPIVIAALVFKDKIHDDWRSLYVIAWALILLALLLGIAELVSKHVRGLPSVRVRDGLVVGLFQTLALIPGVSRSGSTITGALFLGFDRATAARFSFMLSFPSIFLAGVFELYDQRHTLMEIGVAPTVVSTIFSFIFGYLSIAFLIRFLRTYSTLVFILYRILLGIGLLWMLNAGIISPK